MLRPVLLPLLLLALNGPSAAQGLKLQREAETPLRARVHLLSGDEYGQGTRLLGAQLLGDYFLGSRGLRVSGGLMLGPESLPMSDVQQRIDELVKGHRVVLFMKGTAQFPMCGFSGRAIQVLKACGVTDDLTTFNVLEDEDVRQGIKDYANWPTIPQLYVNGEFVGGSDIMMEMYQSGRVAAAAGQGLIRRRGWWSSASPAPVAPLRRAAAAAAPARWV
jgi:monothiol glutaredoxin